MSAKYDLFEIIDKAMETKDRYVSIYFPKDGGVSVNVYPITDDEPEVEKELANIATGATVNDGIN